jgi:queuine tRNA-ribosyltransferase
MTFTITSTDTQSRARCGLLELAHGPVSTPVFMPVGTNATVKAMQVQELLEIGFQIILSNTYHLYLRPGGNLIQKAGGLHPWMNWEKNILTDSGGFQVFSLSGFRKITEEGVEFRSHIDGSLHLLSPELVVRLQEQFNSDILMQLDVCSPWGCTPIQARQALDTTYNWLLRSIDERSRCAPTYAGNLFGIVQGAFFPELREESAKKLVDADTPGIAIGGLSVGEPFHVFEDLLAHTVEFVPNEKVRYVMGIGSPDFILTAIEQGIDMFDCVLPTRIARNGLLFTKRGPLSIKKKRFEDDFLPPDPTCNCRVCAHYSRSYLRHLFRNKEILSSMLCSYHNLYFLHELVLSARRAIEAGSFLAFKTAFLKEYGQGV